MKKSFISLFFILVSAFSFGQFITITPKVGLTYSTLRRFKQDYKPGFLIGISSEYFLSPNLALKPELLLEQKGNLERGVTNTISGKLSAYKRYITWDYLSIPILLKLTPFQNKHVFLDGGGYAGYLVKMTEGMKYKTEGDANDFTSKKDISNFRRWDVGYSFGGGIYIPVRENNKIQIDLRFNRSVELEQNAFPTTFTFSFSLGYSFGLVKQQEIKQK